MTARTNTWKLHAHMVRRDMPKARGCVCAGCEHHRLFVNVLDPFFNRPRFVQFSPYCASCARRFGARGARIANSHIIIG